MWSIVNRTGRRSPKQHNECLYRRQIRKKMLWSLLHLSTNSSYLLFSLQVHLYISLCRLDVFNLIQENVSFKISCFIWPINFNNVRSSRLCLDHLFYLYLCFSVFVCSIRMLLSIVHEITLTKKKISTIVAMLRLISFSFSKTDRENRDVFAMNASRKKFLTVLCSLHFFESRCSSSTVAPSMI